MKGKKIILFLFIFCCLSIFSLGQTDNKNSIEEKLIGSWELVPGANDSAATFNVTFLEPTKYYFSGDYKVRVKGNTKEILGDWKIDKDNNLIVKLIDEDKQEETYEFKFNKLTFDTCILEALDDEPGDGEEPTRMRMKKLSEK